MERGKEVYRGASPQLPQEGGRGGLVYGRMRRKRPTGLRVGSPRGEGQRNMMWHRMEVGGVVVVGFGGQFTPATSPTCAARQLVRSSAGRLPAGCREKRVTGRRGRQHGKRGRWGENITRASVSKFIFKPRKMTWINDTDK